MSKSAVLISSFAPWFGINEDPVTGAAHTVLAPFWNRHYKKNGIEFRELVGEQCSRRGGTVVCKLIGDRVQLIGRTKTTVSGVLKL